MKISHFLLSLCLALILAGCMMQSGAKTAAAPQSTNESAIATTLGTGPQDFPFVSPIEAVNVKVYKDAEEALSSYRTYDFDHMNKSNPLLEKELFAQLEKALQARGLTRDKKNPQILITMDFYMGKKEQYTPPSTITSTKVDYYWNFWGFNQPVPITSSTTTPGYTTTTYYANIRLNFLNRAKLTKGAKLPTPPLIWMGEADNEGQGSDIRTIAPTLFNELAGEFPDTTAKAPKRQVRFCRYGGLGLGFDPKDWSRINQVEPSSVAAENGIKPGDRLLTVNGKGVSTYVPYSLWYIPNTADYRAKDAYYQDILSNHGNSEVELVVKSAETGQKVSMKVKPRVEERFIQY